MTKDVYVMLVDNDKEFVAEMNDLLKSHDYKVMTVDTTSIAMSILSKGKQKIDVIILNVHSSNLLSFDLLAQAVALDIISLVVCDESNELVEKKILEDGAYLYLKKPFDKEIVKYLWQFVLSEKIRRKKAREGSGKNRDQMKVDDIGYTEDHSNHIHEAENDVAWNEKYKQRRKRARKNTKEINEGKNQNNAINRVVRRKVYREWTDDLHAKFMKAVQQLGEGRCYPMEILEVMNLPGLTRMQVASHLQKCRRNNWRSPEERKYIRHLSSRRSSSVSHEPRSRYRKFGTMPRLQANVTNHQRNPYQIQRGPKFPFPTPNTNNCFARGESSIQQLYCPHPQVQHHYLGIGNLFNNPFLSTQTNVGGGLQQQYGPLFGMLGSQGLQVGNTNYRPDLALNNRDHHIEKNYDLNVTHGATYSGSRIVPGTYIENATINDYNLNVNVDNITTYSSGAMMSDTCVGNVTINGLEETNANANFQQYTGEPNMSDPRNIVAVSYDNYVGESNSNEKENCDEYFVFNNVDYLFQNLGPPGANLPNEPGSEFDQVYSDNQVAGASSIQFPGVENHSDESSI